MNELAGIFLCLAFLAFGLWVARGHCWICNGTGTVEDPPYTAQCPYCRNRQ